MAAARHHQLAVGGVIKLPAMDKQGNPVRMHTPECKTPLSCRCEVIYIDKVVMPSERALEFELSVKLVRGISPAAAASLPLRTNASSSREARRPATTIQSMRGWDDCSRVPDPGSAT